MDELTALQDRLRTQRPVEWDQLPDFPLYMDQVLSYMDRQVLRFGPDDGLTAAMVNNYTKSGLVPRAEGKKYNREHLAYLTVICILKRVMSARDIHLLIQTELKKNGSIQKSYTDFLGFLDKALNLAADETASLGDESDLAETAARLALLSYAAGVAGDRCVALLRRQEEAEKRPKEEKKAKKEKEAEK